MIQIDWNTNKNELQLNTTQINLRRQCQIKQVAKEYKILFIKNLKILKLNNTLFN